MELHQLPRDVHRIIVRYCNPIDVIRIIRLISRYWNVLSSEISLWKYFALRDGGNGEYICKSHEQSWEWLWRITCIPLQSGVGYYEPEPSICRRGYLMNGNINGYGIYETSTMIIIGNWISGSPYGNVTIYYSWGGNYVGECVDWLPSGYGVQKDHDGTIYRGMFRSGVKYGFGIYSSDEFSYQGFWKNGLRDGFGSEIKADGSRYTGQYLLDQSHGYGKWDISSDEYYIGQFVNDVSYGEGTWNLIDGSCYTGSWYNGIRHGFGIYRNRDGLIYTGIWENDYPLDESFQCPWHGIFLRNDIDVYIQNQLTIWKTNMKLTSQTNS